MIKIRNANKLPVMDLRQIAKFFAIIKNYEKMLVIEKRAKEKITEAPRSSE